MRPGFVVWSSRHLRHRSVRNSTLSGTHACVTFRDVTTAQTRTKHSVCVCVYVSSVRVTSSGYGTDDDEAASVLGQLEALPGGVADVLGHAGDTRHPRQHGRHRGGACRRQTRRRAAQQRL